MRKLSILIVAVLLLALPTHAFANDGAYSLYYKNARMFGKIMNYDGDKGAAILYGSIYVENKNNSWSLINSKKFECVVPISENVKNVLVNNPQKTVVCEGTLDRWQGQSDEVFKAKKVDLRDYKIETPVWYAFGKTITPDRIYKTNLNKVTDFVDRLAALARVEKIQVNDNEEISPNVDMAAIRKEFENNWNLKWALAKDENASNDQMNGVGGWQIYQGYLGQDNCYIEKSPVIRKNIDDFMKAITAGGGSPEESGPAVMCAYIKVIKSRTGIIEKVTTSGALYDSVSGLVNAFKNPSNLNLETWRLEGYDENNVSKLDGQLCWLSGRRVLVYDFFGNLIDQYFALGNYLIRDEFNQTLNQSRNLIGEGGM